MGILLCEQNFREVWRRNENVRAEIGQILHTHTHAAQLVVRMVAPLARAWWAAAFFDDVDPRRSRAAL